MSFRKQGKGAADRGDEVAAKLYHELSEQTKVLIAKAMGWCGKLERARDVAYMAEERASMASGDPSRVLSRILEEWRFGFGEDRG